MRVRTVRPVLLSGVAGIAAAGITAAGAVSASSPAAHRSSAGYGFSGDAFGSTLQATSAIASGRSARLVLGCTATSGISRANGTEQSQTSPLGQVGSVSTTTGTRPAGKAVPASVSTSTVNGFNLLGGLLQATAVRSTSTASRGATSKVAGATTFTNLRILGHPIDSTPKPNQSYRIKGVGSLVLNQQRPAKVAGTSGLTVNGLALTLAPNNLAGLPAKTRLVLAHATATSQRVGAAPLRGAGFGSALVDNNTLNSGRTYSQPMPCQGTEGKTVSNPGAAISLASALSTGGVLSSAKGTTTSTSDQGTTGSTVHKVSLLGGMITASLIKARAHVVDSDGKVTTSEAGSRFAGLRINGKAMPANVKPNTKIGLGPLGTLWLNRVTRAGRTITVNMIDLHLDKALDGLAQGADLVVANAVTGVGH
jgi:hypothetical protein